MERHIMNLCSEYVGVVVQKLSIKYKFNYDEALNEIELPVVKRGAVATVPRRKEAVEKSKKEHHSSPSIPLPFCGKINDTWCHAIVKNNKLFTQCSNPKQEKADYCKKCVKMSIKEGSMPFGDIQARTQCELMEFKDPKGIAVVPYAVVMKKMNITRENAETEAAKFGWTIDEAQYIMPDTSRGRPKKSTSDEEESSDSEKKDAKRGRPKKDKPVKASSQVGDDIIAGLLAQAQAQQQKPNEEEEEKTSEKNDNSQEEKSNNQLPPPPVVDNQKQKKVTKVTAEEKAAKEAEKIAEKTAKEAAKEAEKAAKEAGKKNKTITKTKTNQTIAVLATTANIKPIENKIEKEQSEEEISSSEEEETAEEEIKVKKFEFEGKKYKRSEPDNILYDWENDEPIGVWNTKTNQIDQLPSEDEDEDEE